MLRTDIRKNIIEKGNFASLNEMQEEMLNAPEKHIALLAPTGSGKTVAFLIYMLQRIVPNKGQVQALIIVPTRELGQQIYSVIRKLAPEILSVVIYGGHPLNDELNKFKSGYPDVIIATPGRLLDHISRRSIDMSQLSLLVIDEMDKCLELGFLPDIQKILKKIPRPEYFILSSATMPEGDEFPVQFGNIKINDFRNDSKRTDGISYFEVPSAIKDKTEITKQLLDSLNKSDKSILFVNHRESAERLYKKLLEKGFPVGIYHGGMDQRDRELSLITFDNGSKPVLIATDLASRGLDIPLVDNVIHYHLSQKEDIFIHRNGRTARAGEKGRVFLIIGPDEYLPDFVQDSHILIPKRERKKEERNSDIVTILFNLGRKDKISRTDILGFLTKQLNIPGPSIGKINVNYDYSTATLPSDIKKTIKPDNIKALKLKGKSFRARFI